ncbi:MAG: hypothetical protein PWR10_1349 [Halanaerobiales bacterium]|nr:hypothetical protein [Halanaerobiales bacterium]
MTDQIYYKVQYPLKKAINLIKGIDPEDPFAGKDKDDFSKEELQQIGIFLDMWEKEGRSNLERVIKKLRKIQ